MSFRYGSTSLDKSITLDSLGCNRNRGALFVTGFILF